MTVSTTTLLDLAKRKVADTEVGLIDETARATPEVSGINLLTGQQVNNLGAAKTIRDTIYKTRVRTGLPTVGFRDVNTGTPYTKQTTENRVVSCQLMNPRWGADKGLNGFDQNLREELAENAEAHLMAAFQQIGKSFYYGKRTTYGGSAKSFPGLLDAVTSDFVVDATGSTADEASSVWVICMGRQDVRWVLGNDGQFEITPVQERDATDDDGNPYTILMQELFAHVGVQVASTQSVARIKNLTAQTGKGLTTQLLRSAFTSLANVGKFPTAVMMSPRSYEQYENHLESLSVVPSEAGKMGFRGVPFVMTNSISDVEAIDLA